MKTSLSVFMLLGVAASSLAGETKTAKKVVLPAEFTALQGVWGSADVKAIVRLQFMDGKIGYQIKDAKTDMVLSFLALNPAEYGEEKGKRFFNLEVTKDTVYKVVIVALKDDRLTVEINDRGEFPLERLSVRASKNAEAMKLLGAWTITGVEVRGQKATPKDIGLDEIVFAEDRYSLKAGGKELLSSFYGIDAAKKPKQLDWFGLKADFVIPLIYELAGDELRVCHPVLGRAVLPRPASFETKGTETLMIRAKRTK